MMVQRERERDRMEGWKAEQRSSGFQSGEISLSLLSWALVVDKDLEKSLCGGDQTLVQYTVNKAHGGQPTQECVRIVCSKDPQEPQTVTFPHLAPQVTYYTMTQDRH